MQKLDKMDSYYVNEHVVNLLLEVRGSLNTDKEMMISSIDRFLNLPSDEKLLFAIGRRFNVFFFLDDLQKPDLHKNAEELLQRILQENPQTDFQFCVIMFGSHRFRLINVS